MKPTVFLVDDDVSFVRSATRLLRSEDLPVESFSSGEDFFEHYETGRPGCLLLDLMMRGMSGLEVLQMMRELDLDLPTIVMTAFGNVPSAVQAMKLGAIDFVEKPIHKNAELKRLIRQSMELQHGSLKEQLAIQETGLKLRSLSEREREVLERLIDGLSSREIASEFDVTLATVNSQRLRIMEKLEVNSVQSLIGVVSRYRFAVQSREQQRSELVP